MLAHPPDVVLRLPPQARVDLTVAGHYVSRGVGAERGQAPRLRLGAVPDVSLITLR